MIRRWQRHGVALVAYSPLGSGHFPGSRAKGGRLHAKIAAAHGATPRQVALRFLVQSARRLPNSATPEHTAENAGAGDLRLTDAEMDLIDEAFRVTRVPASVPCCSAGRRRAAIRAAGPMRLPAQPVPECGG